MLGRQIKEKLRNGETVFGTVLICAMHPMIVEYLPKEGLDFVMVYVEHNALDLADFLPLQYALRSKGIACIARTHGHDPDDITRICDVFPDGVCVPYVEDPRELRMLAAAAKYRPLRGAARQRLVETGEWPSAASRAYIEQFCADTLFLPMIESPTAVRNLDEICKVPGVDAVFVGPQDMTVAMGIPEERDHERFIEVVGQVIEIAGRHGIAAGAHFARLEQAQRLVRQGGRFVLYSVDMVMVRDVLTRDLAVLRAMR